MNETNLADVKKGFFGATGVLLAFAAVQNLDIVTGIILKKILKK